MKIWEKIMTTVRDRTPAKRVKTAADRSRIQAAIQKVLVRDKEILDRLADK